MTNLQNDKRYIELTAKIQNVTDREEYDRLDHELNLVIDQYVNDVNPNQQYDEATENAFRR